MDLPEPAQGVFVPDAAFMVPETNPGKTGRHCSNRYALPF